MMAAMVKDGPCCTPPHRARSLARQLFEALENEHVHVIEVVLCRGADPNLIIEPEGVSAMHLCLRPDHPKGLDVASLLLTYGGNPNVRSCEGITPVHVCAAWGRADVLKLLLKYGGDCNLRDDDGNSALDLAQDNGQWEAVDVLLCHSSDFTKRKSISNFDGAGDRLSSSATETDICELTVKWNELSPRTLHLNGAFPVTNCSNSIEEMAQPAANGIKAGPGTSVSKDYSLNDAYITALSCGSDSGDIWCTVDEYLFLDGKESVALLERQWLPGGAGDASVNFNGEDRDAHSSSSSISQLPSDSLDSGGSVSSKESVPASLKDLADHVIVQKLKTLGENPGPITSSTRRVYLRRLHKLQSSSSRVPSVKSTVQQQKVIYSPQLEALLSGKSSVGLYAKFEESFLQEFKNPGQGSQWRGGVVMSCFNYLLLDPRISDNLPARTTFLSEAEVFEAFVSSIFYVGKGQQVRSYHHFYEALRASKQVTGQLSNKVKRILDIWQSGFGAVSLHCFHGIIAAEAFTREACMIDAIGISNLTNERTGNYYGTVSLSPRRDRCRLGSVFLHRALAILLQEGERQIHPVNLANCGSRPKNCLNKR